MIFLTTSDPHSAADKSRVVQHPQRQPPDGHSEGRAHISLVLLDVRARGPVADSGISPSQHLTHGVPKDMARHVRAIAYSFSCAMVF